MIDKYQISEWIKAVKADLLAKDRLLKATKVSLNSKHAYIVEKHGELTAEQHKSFNDALGKVTRGKYYVLTARQVLKEIETEMTRYYFDPIKWTSKNKVECLDTFKKHVNVNVTRLNSKLKGYYHGE